MIKNIVSLVSACFVSAAAIGAASSAHATVVLDQIYDANTYPRANGNNYGSKSGHFLEPQYNYFSTVVVDDFFVNVNTQELTGVSAVILAQGGTFHTFADIPGWEVAVYSSLDAARNSLTGDVADVYVPASSATLTTNFSNNGDNNAEISLPIDIVLPGAGKYYLGIMSRNPLDTTGWVNVYDFGTAGGANAYNEAPYATNGPTGALLTGGDAAYRIIGQAATVPEPAAWAMLLLAGGGAVLVRWQRGRRDALKG